ncbi:bifunctional 5,10-methylenetetrahydrofolate dehydrogenase/5,10-methenyltetrahydrofolate cyclohydrolase [Acuticoccus yangtzensis]|uniref:bifunctional 5,10-methylenetetrahydrofolate dehydrogenase/5,10-methenyltetrahydrofolate cyclohydrolase n=1 Tax=Acuticoccus yangtzensis TaxID=1443441 RepID=UPI000AC82EE1|nr:bifunctional methylenetetrahydrofolate dehydrogenase/methenyltetrahydrofolate cyclohydrolase FolD [Acuticoccus yangtzensis]
MSSADSAAPSGRPALIDGKAIAATITDDIARRTASLGVKPGLAVVLVGDDGASAVYVSMKSKKAEALGFHSVQHTLLAATTEAELLAVVADLNADPAIHGILVQLPLPAHLDAAVVIAAIDPDKDVDGLSVTNAGRLAVGDPSAIVPCTPLGAMTLIGTVHGADLSGLEAVVIGRSRLVGLPMALLLQQANATVTIAHSRTRDLPAVARRADILVAAVGRAEMVKGDWIKPGATVIDVGTSRVPDASKASGQRLVGDIAFAEAGAAGAITPVPGGVGPMTIAMLMRNTLDAAARRAG